MTHRLDSDPTRWSSLRGDALLQGIFPQPQLLKASELQQMGAGFQLKSVDLQSSCKQLKFTC